MTDEEFATVLRLITSPSDSFRKRVVTLEPRASLPYVPEQWADTFLIVVQGEISVEAPDGSQLRLRAGALLFLARLALRSINNEIDRPAVLVAISRVGADRAP